MAVGGVDPPPEKRQSEGNGPPPDKPINQKGRGNMGAERSRFDFRSHFSRPRRRPDVAPKESGGEGRVVRNWHLLGGTDMV